MHVPPQRKTARTVRTGLHEPCPVLRTKQRPVSEQWGHSPAPSASQRDNLPASAHTHSLLTPPPPPPPPHPPQAAAQSRVSGCIPTQPRCPRSRYWSLPAILALQQPQQSCWHPSLARPYLAWPQLAARTQSHRSPSTRSPSRQNCAAVSSTSNLSNARPPPRGLGGRDEPQLLPGFVTADPARPRPRHPPVDGVF